MTNKTNSRKRGKIKKAVIILFWLGVWELAARVTDNPILLAGPLQTAGELCGLFGEAALYKTIFMSLLRIGLTASGCCSRNALRTTVTPVTIPSVPSS